MAGDWIMMLCNLPESPEVAAICTETGLDRFQVVGRLHTLWSWAYAHSHRGRVTLMSRSTVSRKWIDAKVCHAGFARALESPHVKWLIVTDEYVEFVDFEKHNGKDSKARMLAALRQKRKREKDEKRARKKRHDSVTHKRDTSVTTEPNLTSYNTTPPNPPCKQGGSERARPTREQRRLARIDAKVRELEAERIARDARLAELADGSNGEPCGVAQ